MARVLAALCFLALMVSPFALGLRELKQQTATFCKTDVTVTGTFTGGTGSARSSANCKAEADARNVVEKVVKDWLQNVKEDWKSACTDVAANAIVEGVAEAVAKVFTSVQNTVDIQGTGTACAIGFAEGDAFAVAMVDIFVKVSLSAVKDTFGDDIYKKVEGALDKGTNSATGTAIGEAARAALSSAWASAADNVCTTKNKVSGYDESSAVQIKQAIAFLFAEVVINVCKESGADLDNLKEWESSLSDATAFLEGSAQTVTVVDEATGSGRTGDDDAEECTGTKKSICCRDSQKAQDTCDCGVGCLLETLLDRDSSDIFPSNAKVWKDASNGEACFCTASGN